MHSEYAEISPETAQEILAAKKSGRRVFAVGTTACRTLEAWANEPDWSKNGKTGTDHTGTELLPRYFPG